MVSAQPDAAHHENVWIVAVPTCVVNTQPPSSRIYRNEHLCITEPPISIARRRTNMPIFDRVPLGEAKMKTASGKKDHFRGRPKTSREFTNGQHYRNFVRRQASREWSWGHA